MQIVLEMLINLNVYAFVYIANLFKQYNYKFTLDFSQR